MIKTVYNELDYVREGNHMLGSSGDHFQNHGPAVEDGPQ